MDPRILAAGGSVTAPRPTRHHTQQLMAFAIGMAAIGLTLALGAYCLIVASTAVRP